MAEKESKSLSDFWWSLVPFGALIDRKKLAEGFKRNWHWLFVSAIACGGIVFIVFALINQLIDAESGRYLLSAIAQALAALLAIIFAGVAILGGNEAREIQHLDSYRKGIETILFGSQGWQVDDPEKWPLNSVRKELAQKWKDKEILEFVKIGFTNIVRLFRMRSSQNPYIERKEKFWKELEETFIKPFHLPYEEIRGRDITLKLRESVVEFFEVAKPASDLYEAYGEKRNRNYKILFGVAKEIIDLHVRDSLGVIHRARRARGPLFIFLISLYAVTIAGSLIALAAMKGQGICDSQATLIAAGPLAFAIGAVVMTFLYLYNLVKGEKE